MNNKCGMENSAPCVCRTGLKNNWRISHAEIPDDNNNDQESDDLVTTGRMIGRPLKFLISLIGLDFEEEVQRRNLYMFTLFFLKISSVMCDDIYGYFHGKFIPNLVFPVVCSSLDVVPFAEFTYLFFKLRKLVQKNNQLLSDLCSRTRFNQRTISNHKFCFSSVVLTGYILNLATGVGSLFSADPWINRRTFPFKSIFDERTQNMISLFVFAYEAFVKNYIGLSITIYFSCFNVMMHCKELILARIPQQRIGLTNDRLDSLERLMVAFEGAISCMPLTWLFYCIGPGLIFTCMRLGVIAAHDGTWCNAEGLFLIAHQVFSAFILVAALFILSRKQEMFNEKVDTLTTAMERRSSVLSHVILINRMRVVLKRPVTAFLAFPIDRSLILTFIGSAITFATLFIQLQR